MPKKKTKKTKSKKGKEGKSGAGQPEKEKTNEKLEDSVKKEQPSSGKDKDKKTFEAEAVDSRNSTAPVDPQEEEAQANSTSNLTQ